VLETALRLLHPFMPFITEEIWQRLPGAGPSIMIAPYPKSRRPAGAAAVETSMADVMALVTAIRNIRGEMRVPPAQTLHATVRAAGEHARTFDATRRMVEALARVQMTLDPAASRPAGAALAVVGGSEIYVDLAGVIDVAGERQRLEKEIRKATETITFLQSKLARPEFVERAPAEVVERERERLAAERERAAKLEASLGWLSDARA
jgi:valyl-tRNA synthetase